MNRRAFIAGLGGAAAWPLRVGAQSSAIRRVGYIWIGARGTEVNAAGLSQGLVDQGYLIGRDVAIEDRYADGYGERVPALIAELLALKVILATPGTPITRVAQRATSTVPIVCVTGNPIGFGLVASLSSRGAISQAWSWLTAITAKNRCSYCKRLLRNCVGSRYCGTRTTH